MNTETIKTMTSMQLRKAVKDAGKDPMSDEFSKGDADKMRAFLSALYTPPSPVVLFAGVTSVKLEEYVAPKPAPYSRHPGTISLPDPTNIQPSSDYVAPVSFTTGYTKDLTELYTLSQHVATLELRIATLEQMLNVSNGTMKAIPQPPDQYASLKQYLHDTEDGPELVLTVAQVPSLTLEQKLLVLRLLGDTANNGETPPRVLNQRIVTALQKMREIK